MPQAQPWSFVRAIWMVVPFALWGTAMAAMKPLLVVASPWQLALFRLLPAGVLVLVAAAVLGRSLRIAPADWPWLVAFALVDGSAFQGLLARGLGPAGAGLGSVLIDSQPLLVALLARSLFGEAINPVGWVGLLLGLLGIVCLGLPVELLQHWWLEGPEVFGIEPWSHGELWMLGAAAAMAIGTVLSRYASRQSDPVAITGWHMVLGSLPLLLGALVNPPPQLTGEPPLPSHSALAWAGQMIHGLWPHWTGSQWGLMAYATVLGSALAYGLFFWFARAGDLTGFTALTFLTPVFALVCGVLFLHESLRPLQWLGASLALVSVLLINRRQQIWGGNT